MLSCLKISCNLQDHLWVAWSGKIMANLKLLHLSPYCCYIPSKVQTWSPWILSWDLNIFELRHYRPLGTVGIIYRDSQVRLHHALSNFHEWHFHHHLGHFEAPGCELFGTWTWQWTTSLGWNLGRVQATAGVYWNTCSRFGEWESFGQIRFKSWLCIWCILNIAIPFGLRYVST